MAKSAIEISSGVLREIHRPAEGRRGIGGERIREEPGEQVAVARAGLCHRLGHRGVGRGQRRERLGLGLAPAEIEVVDAHVVMEQAEPRGARLGIERVAVAGMEPGAAAVEGEAEGLGLGPGAAADPVHRLEDGHRLPGPGQRLRRREPRRAGADHDDIDLRRHDRIPMRRSTILCTRPTSPTSTAASTAATTSADQICTVCP